MKNKCFGVALPFLTAAFMFFSCTALCAEENIDPLNDGSQYAWGENVGWFNFEPPLSPGVTVENGLLTGFVWLENMGWINLSCANYDTCATVDYGIINDGSGNLSGLAWSENSGWINFSCTTNNTCGNVDYGVTIDSTGYFCGFAWGENIGWINFDMTTQTDYRVVTGWERGPLHDSDGDGIYDYDDNCPAVSNPSQSDCDSDGTGDVCETNSDNDGLPDECDNCPFRYNTLQSDCDSDGVGDVCDLDTQDRDGDGIEDFCDNCPDIKNAQQLDADNDGMGDVCDDTTGCGGCGEPDCETEC